MSESETFRGRERLVIGGGALASFLLIWEIAADSGLVSPLFIASPTRVAAGAGAGEGRCRRHARAAA